MHRPAILQSLEAFRIAFEKRQGLQAGASISGFSLWIPCAVATVCRQIRHGLIGLPFERAGAGREIVNGSDMSICFLCGLSVMVMVLMTKSTVFLENGTVCGDGLDDSTLSSLREAPWRKRGRIGVESFDPLGDRGFFGRREARYISHHDEFAAGLDVGDDVFRHDAVGAAWSRGGWRCGRVSGAKRVPALRTIAASGDPDVASMMVVLVLDFLGFDPTARIQVRTREWFSSKAATA